MKDGIAFQAGAGAHPADTRTALRSGEPARSSDASWLRNERRFAFLLLAPSALFLLAMAVYPTFYSLWLAFHNYMIFRPGNAPFYGFGNFRDLFADSSFFVSAKITAIFAGCTVFLEFALGLLMAVLLDRKMRGIGLLRTLFIIPVLISPVGMGLTLQYMAAPSYGVANYLLQVVGLPPSSWFSDPGLALPLVILADAWQWSPFVALVILSGMQSVPVDVVEAAELDGLNDWQKLWRIVMPIIMPIVTVVLLIRLIDSLRMFDLVFTLTRGGPGSSSLVMSLYSYAKGFASGDMGVAAAAAWLMVIAINILVVFALRILSRLQS